MATLVTCKDNFRSLESMEAITTEVWKLLKHGDECGQEKQAAVVYHQNSYRVSRDLEAQFITDLVQHFKIWYEI